MEKGLAFLFRDAVQLAAFFGRRTGFLVHFLDKVVGVHHRSFARFHLALGKLHHPVGKVENLVGPVEAQLLENQLQYLEMIVLLIPHHVHVGIQAIGLETPLGGTQILGDIDRCAIAAQHQLAVQAVGRKVAPDRTVGVLDENALREALLHQFLAQKIGLTLVVNLVEGDAEGGIGLIEALVHPTVHHRPELPHVRIVLLPLQQHLVRGPDGRRLFFGLLLGKTFRHQALHFLFIEFVERHIAVAHQVVALLSGRFRRGAVKEFFPGVHTLADVHAAVIHDGTLDDLVAAGLQQARHAITQQVIADMPQMEGFVGIRRGELHHDVASRSGKLAERSIARHRGKHLVPIQRRKADIQESLHAIERGHLGHICHQIVSDGLSGIFRCGMGDA